MSSPDGACAGKRAYQRPELFGSRGMNPEQNNAGLFQWPSALNGNLPEVLVEREDGASFGFSQIQQGKVFPSGEIRAGPEHIVTFGP